MEVGGEHDINEVRGTSLTSYGTYGSEEFDGRSVADSPDKIIVQESVLNTQQETTRYFVRPMEKSVINSYNIDRIDYQKGRNSSR